MVGSVASIDLGATSGRVVLGRVGPRELAIREAGRFANVPLPASGPDGAPTLRWDLPRLQRDTLAAVRAAVREAPDLLSIGVDSWGVDYGLLRGDEPLDLPFHYRDGRTSRGVASVHSLIGPEELYRRSGTQPMPINTVYQLRSDLLSGRLDDADLLLLMPDLLRHWLTGERGAEATIASTTGLLGVDGGWDRELLLLLGIPASLLPPLIWAGGSSAPLLPDLADAVGAGRDLRVVAVGSHDTASAVAATPLIDEESAYVSCGTWGLVGVELEAPRRDDASRRAGFSNELGIDGRVRYLRSLMGLWLLDQTVRDWGSEDRRSADLAVLLEQAGELRGDVPLLDPGDPAFAAPGAMPARIVAWFAERGISAPRSRPELVRVIVESLAASFVAAVDDLSRLTGRTIRRLHLVGGGSRNALLCQAVADRSGLPVLAGPTEATAIGSILVQARERELIAGDLETLRALVRTTFPPHPYRPRGAR
jgi:rhamnulokinase